MTELSNSPAHICIAKGDGIGPEIMEATLRILEAAGAKLQTSEIRIGKSVYEAGHTSGMEPEAWDVIRETGIMLKAPITTPQGGGVKSLNVTLRKTLGLYANIRPNRAYAPFVPTHHPKMDLVIVRENEEDTYAGIEHQQTREVTQCLKLISRPGCERLIRYAFEYAKAQGRRKLTCMTKDNIMKLTDGLFHQVFEEIAPDYPDLETDHMIIDIGAARLANQPEAFDVIVAPNLYGDIISDIAAEVAGSVGLAGSANLGQKTAMFEAIHGSAPDIAGQDKANPSALLKGAVMMLVHIGQGDVAARVENALLATIEDGIHTADIASDLSREVVGTRAFTNAVIERLGQVPQTLGAVDYPASASGTQMPAADSKASRPREKTLTGMDIFLDWDANPRDPNDLGPALEAKATEALKLKMITNRGVKVYPDGHPETFCTDHWRCRFVSRSGGALTSRDLVDLQAAVVDGGFDIIKTENLYEFDGQKGYSLGQGE
jgi:isocitrate dehydrogenase